jgi:hypothetical protein
MKLFVIVTSLMLGFVNIASAVVSFNIKGELLKNSSGTAAATSTLAFLVADTNSNGFGAVSLNASTSAGSFLNGSDDQILGRFDLSTFATAGVLSTSLTGITVAQGTPLALYWFPTLTLASSTVTGGSTYGSYVGGTAVNGSSVWTAPANGTSLYKLFYYNADATTLNAGGANASNTGNASFTVAAVPEPSRVMLLGLGLGAFIVRRRRNA